MQLFIFFVIMCFDEGLGNSLVGRKFFVLRTNLPSEDFYRVTHFQEIICYPTHCLGSRCHEEQHLTNFDKLFHHRIQILLKPYVQHTIAFVQN